MLRSIAAITAAILFCQPTLSKNTAKSYAKMIQVEAKKRHFDPFSIVAIIHGESSFRATVVSANGEDYGLTQLRARNIGACRQDADPVNNPSPACKAVKASLLNPAYNIQLASSRITLSRDFCRKLRGRATYHGWLSVWQGSMKQHDKKTWCKKNKHTTRVVKKRRQLVRKFGRL